MACSERRWIRPDFEREIPAAIPTLALIRLRRHLPHDGVVGGVRDSNPRDVRGNPAEHVDVCDDLAIMRRVEVQRRAKDHVPECDLSQGSDAWSEQSAEN